MECATSGVDGIVRTWDLRNATRYHDAPKEEDRERLAKEDLLNLDTKMTTLTKKRSRGHRHRSRVHLSRRIRNRLGRYGRQVQLVRRKAVSRKRGFESRENIQRRPNGFRKANYQVRDELSFTLQ